MIRLALACIGGLVAVVAANQAAGTQAAPWVAVAVVLCAAVLLFTDSREQRRLDVWERRERRRAAR